MRNRKRYDFEIIETVLSIAIIIMAIILIFKSAELSVLYPIVFGLSAVLAVLYALEGILYNRNRVVKKTRLLIFGITAAILIVLMVVSIITIVN